MVVTLAAPRLSSHLGQVLLNLFFDSLGLKASTIAILTAASCCIFENDLHQRTNLSNLATPLLPLNLVLWKCTVTDLFLLRILCQPFGQEVNSVLLASLIWHWSTTASIAIERIELVRGNWETVTTGRKNGPVTRPPGHNKYGLRILPHLDPWKLRESSSHTFSCFARCSRKGETLQVCKLTHLVSWWCIPEPCNLALPNFPTFFRHWPYMFQAML